MCFNARNTSGIKISQKELVDTEMEITFQEFGIALKQLKNSKCPGLDGLPCDFYKVFFAKIGQLMFDVLITSLKDGILWDSALRGVINLIPKQNKDVRWLKNLRPITLLNTDYKIIEKILANRIKPTLDNLIHSNQKGFMKNRWILANIRKILDLTQKMDQNDREGLVLSIDFMKCFDKIEFQAIFKSLEYFGFGENLRRWTEILYTGFNVCVQNNGYFSKPISIKRSVHQGGCCSTYYFLLCAEVLAIELRQNQKIRGILVDQLEYLLGQYADDLDCYMNND